MSEVFIGRQPIFNRKLKLFAYELLARSDMQNVSNSTGDAATSQVIINALMEIGLENIVGKHPAFFKLTRNFLLEQELGIFSTESTIFAIPNDIEVDDSLLAAVQGLKAKNYQIALDNFVYREELLPLIKLADIVKVDTLNLDENGIRKHVEMLKKIGTKVLAQKVETPEQFNLYQDLGVDYFQGFFFAKPTVVTAKRVPANKMTVLQLLAKVNDPDVNMDELSELIQQDVSLSVKVLKYINSPMSGLTREIESIKQALVLLGVEMIKYWVSIMAMADLDMEGRPDELITTLLTRAKTCELLADASGEPDKSPFFTVGLFSALDVIMEVSMEEVLKQLPLAPDIKDALLDLKGDMGQALRCAMAMESGMLEEAHYKELSPDVLSNINIEAMHWADELREHTA
jgi:EAL and modified HD-GYP domain-containing signal transduction protein